MLVFGVALIPAIYPMVKAVNAIHSLEPIQRMYVSTPPCLRER
jgi:hypothetical protein